jgi:glycolate oxidase iron-sulfur subunit
MQSEESFAKNGTALAPAAKNNPGLAVDYSLFLDCVHCGLCTSTCPTYAELGDENDGPRGRIHLMRAVADNRLELTAEVRRHLELCLDCRACETACPSGVQYGQLIEPFRIAMQHCGEEPAQVDSWFHRHMLLGTLPYPQKTSRLLFPVRFAQRFGLLWLARRFGMLKLLPKPLQRLTTLLPPAKFRGRRLPEILPSVGKPRARVVLFTGCVADVFFRRTHWATARVLQQNGCDVLVPRNQVCCGAIHWHAGSSEPARKFADENIRALKANEVDAVIVNVAGCGAMLKGYGLHWHDEEQRERMQFTDKVKDVHEFLADLGPIAPTGEINLTATYHDACHLAHAQQIRESPRQLLSLIPGLELRELPESELCCGAAGTYNLTQPEMAARLAQRKLDNILSTGATAVVTANAGCILQIAREARNRGKYLPIYHPMDLLDQSYRKGQKAKS